MRHVGVEVAAEHPSGDAQEALGNKVLELKRKIKVGKQVLAKKVNKLLG